MQRVDIVIGVIAAVALTGSLLGVALYDEPEFRRYDVDVIEDEGTDDVFAASLTGPGASDDGTWTIDQNNLTSITFTIEALLTNDSPLRSSDTVIQVEFTLPDGANVSDEPSPVQVTIPGDGTSGTETITIEIQETPSGENRVLARDADGALEGDDGPIVPTTTNGTGEWTIQAAITSGGGMDSPVPGSDPLQAEEIDVTITADYAFYRAESTLHIPGDSSVI